MANASSTVALVPGSFSASFSYRDEFREFERSQVRTWLFVCIVGGIIGAVLLLHTPDTVFRRLAPWLLLFATVLFAFGTPISNRLGGRLHGNQLWMIALLLPISIYGGYFGGGMGIMLLAALRLYGMTGMHAMNGLKTLLGATLNLIASALFIADHLIWWRQTLVMMACAIAGGFIGPVIARRFPQRVLKGIVIAVGAIMTVWFFTQA